MNILKRSFNLKMASGAAKFEVSTIGPVLSPFTNRDTIKLFCDAFNQETKLLKPNLDLFVTLYLNYDHTFFFVIKGLRAVQLLQFYHCQFDVNASAISVFALFDVFLIKYHFIIRSLLFKNDVYLACLYKSMIVNLENIKKA